MDRPKLLEEPVALNARLAQIHDAHMAPLTTFIQRLRERMGPNAAIPYIDPWDGGIEAEVMFLLEAPGPRARNSGFVSMNNPDESAKNFYEISREAGIERKRIVIWNAVPGYIGCGTRIRPANSRDLEDGLQSLPELLQLLPKLRAIVFVGNKARKAEMRVRAIAPHLRVFFSAHPSPMFVNRKPENRGRLLNAWRGVQSSLCRLPDSSK